MAAEGHLKCEGKNGDLGAVPPVGTAKLLVRGISWRHVLWKYAISSRFLCMIIRISSIWNGRKNQLGGRKVVGQATMLARCAQNVGRATARSAK